jgi:hypothetical protein
MRSGRRENELVDEPGTADSDQIEFATIVVHEKGFRTATPVGS